MRRPTVRERLITLTSPDGTKFQLNPKKIRLIEPRDFTDKKNYHSSVGSGQTRIYMPGGQIWVACESVEDIQAMINPPVQRQVYQRPRVVSTPAKKKLGPYKP